MARLIVICFLLSACGTFKSPTLKYDKEFTPYISEYLEYKKEYLGTDRAYYSIDIYFGELGGNIAGVCHRSKTRWIIVDRERWNKYSDQSRLWVIMHEMGHCDLNIMHQEEIYGIMNSHGPVNNLTDEQIEDFFTRGF